MYVCTVIVLIFSSGGRVGSGAFRNYFICLLCSRPMTNSRGFQQSNFWSFLFRIIFFQILGKALLELQAPCAIEITFCQDEIFFSWSSLSSDNSHVCVKLLFTSTWKRKYYYIMWLPRARGGAQGTRSSVSTPHTELWMKWDDVKNT